MNVHATRNLALALMFTVLSASNCHAFAQPSAAKPQVVTGTDPEPQVVTGTDPEPQVVTGTDPEPQALDDVTLLILLGMA